MKLIVSDPETGKSYQKELDKNQVKVLYNLKIGDRVKGDQIGLVGYELVITGGSDNNGFPMRSDLHGTSRKRILLSKGPGFHPKRKGERKRKTVRGNTVAEDIAQLNVKVVKAGNEKLDKLLGKEKEEKKEKKE